MDENDYYILFELGYDLLHHKLMKCEEKACDSVWYALQSILDIYKQSEEYHDFHNSQYTTLQNFVNNHEFEIDTELYNQLNYKGVKYGEETI